MPTMLNFVRARPSLKFYETILLGLFFRFCVFFEHVLLLRSTLIRNLHLPFPDEFLELFDLKPEIFIFTGARERQPVVEKGLLAHREPARKTKVLLTPVGRVYLSEIVYNLIHGLISTQW